MLTNLFDLDGIKNCNYRPIDPEAVEALAASIKEVGLHEPIKLFEATDTHELFVVSGHHRLEALKKIKKDPDHSHKIFQAYITKGSIKDLDSQNFTINSLIPNILRKNLGIVDRAEAYAKLKTHGLAAKQIAQIVQKDKRTVEMTLNVALIPEQSKAFIRDQPKLKEAAIYKLAVKYKKDPNFDIEHALQIASTQKKQRAGATKEAAPAPLNQPSRPLQDITPISRKHFHNKLAELDFSESDRIKIMSIFDSFEISPTDR